MPKQPLTDAQENFLAGLRLQNIDHRALVIVEAACRYRNAQSPSGVMNRDEAQDDLFRPIDKVS
ncbi:MAG TPA: hypothetical protein VIG24_16965 [Acidimicrobiia bacterium]